MQFSVNEHQWICQRQQNCTSDNCTIGQVQMSSLKNLQVLITPNIAREIMLLLVNDVHEKTLQKSKTDKILKACTCYL